MQKMIKTSVVLLGVIFLAGCSEARNSQTQSIVPTPNTQSPTSHDDTSLNTINGIEIEKIIRAKGEKCATSGPDERYNNLPLASETYLYTDPFGSITLGMPFNRNWKFEGCEVGPFTQFKDGDGVIVYFGQPSSWGPDQYRLRIDKLRTVSDIESALMAGKEDSSLPRAQMKKIVIGDLEAFRWQENGMGEMAKIEVVGKSFNYEFESSIRGEGELINIIKTLKFLQSVDYQQSDNQIEVADKCDSPSKDTCEAKSECYWKNAGGKTESHYSCCPKDVENSPERCSIMVD